MNTNEPANEQVRDAFADNLEKRLNELINGFPSFLGWCWMAEDVAECTKGNDSYYLEELIEALEPKESYPIPSDDPSKEAEEMFHSCLDKYGDHPYGEARIAYARDYIKRVREYKV